VVENGNLSDSSILTLQRFRLRSKILFFLESRDNDDTLRADPLLLINYRVPKFSDQFFDFAYYLYACLVLLHPSGLSYYFYRNFENKFIINILVSQA